MVERATFTSPLARVRASGRECPQRVIADRGLDSTRRAVLLGLRGARLRARYVD